jgi:hypothetical protein
MTLFNKFKLSRSIQKRKVERPYVRIEEINEYCYYLRDMQNKTCTLHIDFVGMNPMPSVGDGFYLSENMVEGMRENLYSFTFSTQIGKAYARQPHDFLKNPKEFMIFEYLDGKTILLEQWYG